MIFDVQRSDDTDWLTEQRERVAEDDCYSEADKIEIQDAINQRFSQLNLLEMQKRSQAGK